MAYSDNQLSLTYIIEDQEVPNTHTAVEADQNTILATCLQTISWLNGNNHW